MTVIGAGGVGLSTVMIAKAIGARVIGGHPRIPMTRAIGWELDLLGSHGMAAADYPGMLALIELGELRP